MAHSVAWLPDAIADIEAIAEYIATDSPAHASAVVSRMFTCAEEIADSPYSFPRVPEWDDVHIRQRIVYSYRLIFRIREDRIEMLAVVHGARLLPGGLSLPD